jgi:UDP:flavonoid glycosyltransferase YjiC (YdhE family)
VASTCSSTRPPRATKASPRPWPRRGSSAGSTACDDSISEEQVEGNLRYRPFSEQGFIDDLASARGVIAGGGFTLMGEAVYLHKPMLAVPVGGQFEQVLNSRYLALESFGTWAPDLDDPATVLAFVAELHRFEDALSRYEQRDNAELLSAVDEFLDRAAASLV